MLKLTDEWLTEHGFESAGLDADGVVTIWQHKERGLTYYASTAEEQWQFSVRDSSLDLWLETEKFGLSSEQAVLDVVHVLALVKEMY